MPKNIINELPSKIKGEIVDYKITDAMGIGYVLVTNNKIKIWVFDYEINEETKNYYNIRESNNIRHQTTNQISYSKFEKEYNLNNSMKIGSLINPINFINWVRFTLNDVI